MTRIFYNIGSGTLLSLLAVGAFVTTASSTVAGGVCAPHDVLVERLAETYDEHPSHRGVTGSDYMVEVFSSQNFNTWTVTVRRASGPTCLVASGRGRADLNAELADRS